MANRWRRIPAAWLMGLTACASGGNTTKETAPAAPPAAALRDVFLPPTGLRFTIDQSAWQERDLGSRRNPGVVAMRAFFRAKAATDAQCPAAIAVIAESVPSDLGVVEYSAAKRNGMPPHVMELVFSHVDGLLQLKNAVGYRLRGSQGCHPVVHIVHARDADVGYLIVIEVDPRDYTLIDGEVRAILKSLWLPAGDAGQKGAALLLGSTDRRNT